LKRSIANRYYIFNFEALHITANLQYIEFTIITVYCNFSNLIGRSIKINRQAYQIMLFILT